MKFKVISQGPIEELFKKSKYLKANNGRIMSIDNELYCFDRRALLRMASSSGISLVSLPMFLREETDAAPVLGLIQTAIALLQLFKEIFSVRESTQGSLRLINMDTWDKAGEAQLKVVRRGKVEDLDEGVRYGKYQVPAREYIDTEFDNGPEGWFPGRKHLKVTTQRDVKQAPMIVQV
jgi:hypothetical protein